MRSVASRVIAASALLAVIFIVAAVVAVEDQRAVAAGVGTMVTAVLLAAGLAAYLIRSVVLRSDELESQNAINAAVIDGVRDGIVLRDLEGRVVVANRTMDTFAREIDAVIDSRVRHRAAHVVDFTQGFSDVVRVGAGDPSPFD